MVTVLRLVNSWRGYGGRRWLQPRDRLNYVAMDLEVCRVPGLHDCFAALPLRVIEALQQRNDAPLSFIALELRLSNVKDPCYLAWVGAASTSYSIEVSDKLAECMGLPAWAGVHVKALANVAHADRVVLEPATEDDWEILELNAGFVEDHILSQVGVLCSGQLFPVWVQGQNVLRLHVISTSPNQVVRLVPGTELIIAPKPRKSHSHMLAEEKVPVNAPAIESSTVKARLRVQELNPSLAQSCELNNFSCYILPTTSIFVSPGTAEVIPFNDGQLVVVNSVDTKRIKKKSESEKRQGLKIKTEDAGKVDKRTRIIVLRLLYCNLVSEGHVMIASSLRLFLGVGIHSCIEVKGVTETPSVIKPLVMISPVEFQTAERPTNDAGGNNHGLDEITDGFSHLDVAAAEKIYEDNAWEWEKHKEFLTITTDLTDITREAHGASNIEGKCPPCDVGRHKAKHLFKLWLGSQIAAVSNSKPGQCSSVPVSREIVMQFQLPAESRRYRGLSKMSSQESGLEELLENRDGYKKKPSGILSFLLSLHNLTEDRNHRDVYSGNHETTELTSYKGHFLFDLKLLESDDSQGGYIPGQSLRIKLGQPCHIICPVESALEENRGPKLDSLTWLKGPASEALNRLKVLLSTEAQDKFQKLGLVSPGYVLLHGPPACGKTKLALAIARELEEDPSILAHKILVKCAKLGGEQAQAVRAALRDAVSDALRYAPSLIILDDLDMAIPSMSSSDSSEPSTNAVVLTEFLSDLLDTLQVCGRKTCGRPIAFLALARSISNLPAPLCSSGRFDFHVALPAATSTEQRAAIIRQELDQRNFSCQEHIITEIAAKCDGYDTADLEVVVDRAVHVAAARFLSFSPLNVACMEDSRHLQIDNQKAEGLMAKEKMVEKMLLAKQKHKLELFKEDFAEALEGFLPVSMRDIAKPGSQAGQLGWEGVGGLSETCRTLQEMLELPVKYRSIFSNAPLRLRTGVLLYGPPGCGKTHVVGAAAAACSLRLISVKGPELLNKYIGASEQGVRDIFAKATAAAPCILFFDEFDAIAPKRGHDNTGVTDRVVNQLLTELDGVEALNGVFVFAATSRPDLLDAALLRPGRLDRLLLCDFPTARERLEILQVLSRKLPLAEDVNLNVVASSTENFSGADLQAVLSDAQLESVHNFLIQSKSNDGISSTKSKSPIITMEILRSVLIKARPSVSEGERQRLYDIYKVFMSSRSSIAGKARDAKGKRATLA